MIQVGLISVGEATVSTGVEAAAAALQRKHKQAAQQNQIQQQQQEFSKGGAIV